jgi:hypothetical protein
MLICKIQIGNLLIHCNNLDGCSHDGIQNHEKVMIGEWSLTQKQQQQKLPMQNGFLLMI